MNKPHKYKDLIIAWANGAEIQYWDKNTKTWKSIYNPVWSELYEFRIKPEPKLVPFTWEDRELLRGKWIRNKLIGIEYIIDTIGESDSILYISGIPNYKLLEDYTFLDGSPCGKYTEE